MADRVVVFLDYQNVYYGAREAFHPFHAPPWEGHVDPLKLGEHIVRDSPFDRELDQVRVYRGRPDSAKDPRGYGANVAWSSPVGHSRRLSVSGTKIWCHWLDESAYRAVAHTRDYSRP